MQRKRRFWDGFLDVGFWLLFFALLLPAAFVGYAIGDDGGGATHGYGGRGRQAHRGAGRDPGRARVLRRRPDRRAHRALDHERRHLANQRYSPLDEIDTDNVVAAQGRLDDRPQRLRHRRQVLRRGPADRLRGDDVRPDGRRRRLRRRRRHRQDPLGVRGAPRAEDQHRLLRLALPRRRDRRRQGLPRPARRQARRARPEDRQGRVDDLRRPLAGRLHAHPRAALLRRHGDRGRLRRRVLAARPRRRLRREDGQAEVALLDDPRPRRDRPRHVAAGQRRVEDGRRSGLADPGRRPRARPALLLHRQRRPRPRTAASARATTCSRPRSSRSTPRPASTAGTTSRSTTTSGTTTARARSSSSTSTAKKGLAQASKTGWLYLLDRETGEPLLPIPEKPVPQLASQKTAKTQPIPSYPPFIPHEVTAEHVQAVNELKRANKPLKDVPVKRAEEMYTPFDDKAITVVVPGPQGGTNWQPTSYSPETEMFYVCAQAAFSGLVLSHEAVPPGKQGSVADLGGSFVTTGLRRPPRLLQRDRRPHRRDRVAEALAGVVLLGLDRDGGRARLRRPQQRPPRGVRRRERRAQVELPDRRRRQLDGDRVRARRRPADRVPRGRQRARGDAARRQPVALLPERDDGGAQGRRRGGEKASATPVRRRPSRQRATATRRRARPSGRTTAPAATGSPARAETAAPI